MNGSGESVPSDVLTVETCGASTVLRVAADAYPTVAVYGAAFLFLDRCWVLLDRPDAAHVRVTLAARDGGGPALDPAAAAEEFAEELVSCAWRTGIARETRQILEAATSAAHSGGDAPPSIDDLATFDFAADGPRKDP